MNSFDKLVAALVLVGSMFALVVVETALAQGEPAYRDTGVVVTASPHWKPYSFVDPEGKPAGFFVDYWTKWGEKTGVPVTFKLVAWNETIEQVANGGADIQSGLYYTDERAERFAFSDPVFYSKAVTAVTGDVECGSDLSGLRWGGVEGTVEKDFATKLSSSPSIRSFENSRLLFSALASGEIQATVDDWSTVLLLGKEMGLDDAIKICATVYEKDLLAIVHKDRPELLDLLNQGIGMFSDYDKQVLIDKWFIGDEDTGSWRRHAILLAVLVIGATVVVAFRVSRRRS